MDSIFKAAFIDATAEFNSSRPIITLDSLSLSKSTNESLQRGRDHLLSVWFRKISINFFNYPIQRFKQINKQQANNHKQEPGKQIKLMFIFWFQNILLCIFVLALFQSSSCVKIHTHCSLFHFIFVSYYYDFRIKLDIMNYLNRRPKQF